MPHLYLRFLIPLLGILTATAPALAAGTPDDNEDKKNFTLVIDPGHGGHDAGACGSFGKEKNINLNVALALGRLVKNNCPDVKVVYTRQTDVFIPLQQRADIANRNKADLFISIHTNALPKGRIAYGAETYTLGTARAAANLEVAKRENSVIIYEKNYQQTYQGFDPNKTESYIIFELLQDRNMKQSVELARCIQQQYTSAGRKNKGVHQAGFLVLRNTTMPAVLTELGFISTPEEERYLCSEAGVAQLARSIYNGFINYRRTHGGTTSKALRLLPETDDKPAAQTQTQEVAGQSASAAPAAASATPEGQGAAPDGQDAAQCKQDAAQSGKPAQESTTGASDAATPEGKDRPVFKVQIMAVDRTLRTGDPRFKGLKGVEYYREGNMYKYTYGQSTSYNEIRTVQKSIAAKFPDTFIVAFVNGQRTELHAAIRQARTVKQ